MSSSQLAGLKPCQVCKMLGVSKATLFRWERAGVIEGPPRDWRNWRLYTRQNMEEIKKVIRGRKVVV